MSQNKRGFTLVEIMIVSALVGVVAITVFSSFSAGARLWNSLRSTNSNEDINIFFAKFQSDLQGSFYYSGMPFEGSTQKMSFATFANVPPELGGRRGLGLLSYEFDESHHSIKRSLKNLNDLHKEKQVASQSMLSDVLSANFSYFMFNKEENTFVWLGEWIDKEKMLPLAVRVEFEVRGPNAEGSFTRTVSLPAGTVDWSQAGLPV